jgi:small-conductance mechanosensitive channel
MIQKTYRLFAQLLLVALLHCATCTADSAESAAFIDFKVTQAQLTLIETNLTSHLDRNQLSHLIIEIDDLIKKTSNCLLSAKSRLTIVNRLLQEHKAVIQMPSHDSVLQTLQEEKNQCLTKIAYCDFFNDKFQQLKTIAHKKMAKHTGILVFKKDASLINMLTVDLWNHHDFNVEPLQQDISKYLFDKKHLLYLCMISVISLALLFIFRRMLNSRLSKKTVISSYFLKTGDLLIRKSPIWVTLFLICCILNAMMYRHHRSIILLMFNALMTYVFILFVNKVYVVMAHQINVKLRLERLFNYCLLAISGLYTWLIFIKRSPEGVVPIQFFELVNLIYLIVSLKVLIILLQSAKTFPQAVTKKMHREIIWISSTLLLTYCFFIIAKTQTKPSFWFDLGYFIFLFSINMMFYRMAHYLLLCCFFSYKVSQYLQKFADFSLKLLFISVCILDFIGYYRLGLILLPNVVITLIALIIIRDFILFINELYVFFNDANQLGSQRLRLMLGVTPMQKLPELFFMRILMSVPLVTVVLYGLIALWSQSAECAQNFEYQLFKGINLLGHSIQPLEITRAILVFCMIFFIGHWVKAQAYQKKWFAEDHHTQQVFSSIIYYSFIIIALFIALYISGIKLSSLVIVSGAMSFGIGFGLQHFANDFISGLILLINKPIKIGDHVIIDNVEGYIKKIGALTTQLTTLDHSDDLIPNSNLLTKPLLNLTFNDNKYARIKIVVTFDQPVDLNSAKNILLRVAKNNKNVILDDQKNQVNILFQMNALILLCVISNVNKKESVISELNLAITIAFMQEKIAIRLS